LGYLYGDQGKGDARGTPDEAAGAVPSRWSKFVKKNSWPVAPPSTTPIWSGYAPESRARVNTERPSQAADVTPRARWPRKQSPAINCLQRPATIGVYIRVK